MRNICFLNYNSSEFIINYLQKPQHIWYLCVMVCLKLHFGNTYFHESFQWKTKYEYNKKFNNSYYYYYYLLFVRPTGKGLAKGPVTNLLIFIWLMGKKSLPENSFFWPNMYSSTIYVLCDEYLYLIWHHFYFLQWNRSNFITGNYLLTNETKHKCKNRKARRTYY